MCGIAGILADPDRPPPDAARIRPALSAMVRRGPDDEGVFAEGPLVFGVRRLAILDREGGRQPLASVDGRHVIAFNGAIHDHVEQRERLAADGAEFRTRSDTEVLLAKFVRDGPAGLADLSGMFAFAVYDRDARRLTLARDAFGAKPLLFARDEARGEWHFASDLGAIAALSDRPLRLDRAALLERLAFQTPLSDRTLATGVASLPPGSWLKIDGSGRVERGAWFDASFAPEEGRREAEWEEALRAELLRAGRIALRADVPLAATLSGGLDSSLVAGLAVAAGRRPPAFTGYFDAGPEYDERPHARRAAAELGLQLEEVPVAPADLVERIAELSLVLEGPIAGPGSLPQLVVAERAAREATVLLGGHGADELFGGYARHRIALLDQTGELDPEALPPDLLAYRPLLARLPGPGRGGDLADLYFPLVYRGDGVAPLLGPALAEAWGGYDARAAFGHAFRAEDGDPFHLLVSYERRSLLPALLHVEDRTTMARSVESRAPLLDLRIFDLARRIPSRVAIGEAEPKRILRRAARGIAPPAALARRDKMGFPVPLPALAAGPAGAAIRARLADGPLVREGLLAPDAPARLLAAAGGHGRHLWFFLLLSEWMAATPITP